MFSIVLKLIVRNSECSNCAILVSSDWGFALRLMTWLFALKYLDQAVSLRFCSLRLCCVGIFNEQILNYNSQSIISLRESEQFKIKQISEVAKAERVSQIDKTRA